MVFTRGSKNTWLLGNALVANRIRMFSPQNNIPQKVCSVCGDPSQVELHTAKAMVINCMDFRLRDNMSCHLNRLGYKNKYDEVIGAGASLAYNGLLDYSGWNTYIDQHIQLAFDLHDISEIIIIDHMHCGAYKEHYATAYPDGMTDEEEYQLHIENLDIATNTIFGKFNPTDGTVAKITDLKITTYILAIDACSMDKIST